MPWSASDPDVYVPAGGGGTPGTPGDICPQGWDEIFDRAQMTTQVFIGRILPSEIPELRYTLRAGVSVPATGEFEFSPGDSQLGADIFMQIHRTTADSLDAYSWLQYLTTHCQVRLTDAAYPKITRTYTVTAPVTFYEDDYFAVPVVWSEGEGDDGGPVDPNVAYLLKLTLVAEPPQLWEDPMGKTFYGAQPLSRLDLINTETDLFETLADRILEVRGINSVPRIEAVTIDARTGHGTWNMDLMSTARPETPSRYLLRLAVDERPIFDRMCFVSGIRHFITRDEWTLRISLDIAEWAAQL